MGSLPGMYYYYFDVICWNSTFIALLATFVTQIHQCIDTKLSSPGYQADRKCGKRTIDSSESHFTKIIFSIPHVTLLGYRLCTLISGVVILVHATCCLQMCKRSFKQRIGKTYFGFETLEPKESMEVVQVRMVPNTTTDPTASDFAQVVPHAEPYRMPVPPCIGLWLSSVNTHDANPVTKLVMFMQVTCRVVLKQVPVRCSAGEHVPHIVPYKDNPNFLAPRDEGRWVKSQDGSGAVYYLHRCEYSCSVCLLCRGILIGVSVPTFGHHKSPPSAKPRRLLPPHPTSSCGSRAWPSPTRSVLSRSPRVC